MTIEQKETIKYLRMEGVGYTDIASRLDISANTIKSFCRRNGLMGNLDRDTVCRQCGAELHHLPGRRAKKFCSASCRLAWWNERPYLMERKAFYTTTCTHCGQSFDSYGNNHRKYCSHGCYIQARFGKVDDDGESAVRPGCEVSSRTIGGSNHAEKQNYYRRGL